MLRRKIETHWAKLTENDIFGRLLLRQARYSHQLLRFS